MMHYDVAVIGGGIAGYSVALRALQPGKKVVLINLWQSALHFLPARLMCLAVCQMAP